MSTRCAIIVENLDKTAQGIYNHFDGYLESKQPNLLSFYNSEEKARELIGLGDISSLGESIEETEAYADRGEEICITEGNSWRRVASQIGHNGYIYVYSCDLAQWMFAFDSSDDLIPLIDAKEPDEDDY